MTAPTGATDTETTTTETKPGDGGTESARVFSQDELNSILAKHKRDIEGKFQGFDQLKDKAAKFDALEESSKTEVQKATEVAAQYKAQLEEAQASMARQEMVALRNRIAHAKGLDPKLCERVRGETEEEITADVEDLLTLQVSKPKTYNGGLRSGAMPIDAATAKERAAAALRNARER